jgi:hypothetical protein
VVEAGHALMLARAGRVGPVGGVGAPDHGPSQAFRQGPSGAPSPGLSPA